MIPESARPGQDSVCEVWWADIAAVRPEHLALLDEQETARRSRLRRDGDRTRLTAGVVLTRLVVGRHLGLPPAAVPLTRSCPECAAPHGKPRVLTAAGDDHEVRLSVSHSAARVVLAVHLGAAVGVDVELIDPAVDVQALADQILSPDEWAGYRRAADPRTALLRYWTRKEAVLKATGDGLRVPMRDLTVSPPDAEPALLGWRGRPDHERRVAMTDLSPGPGYVAGLAALDLDGPAPRVLERDGTALLESWAAGPPTVPHPVGHCRGPTRRGSRVRSVEG